MTINTAKLLRERLRVFRARGQGTQSKTSGRWHRQGGKLHHSSRDRADRAAPYDAIDKICEFLQVSPSELFFADGLDDNADVLRQKIQNVLKTPDTEQLRKFYRHMLVALEK